MLKNFKTIQMKKLLISGIAILFGFSVFAQTALLKLNLEKDKVYRLRSVTEQTVSQTMNGNQQNTESNVTHTFTMKMMDVTPEFVIVEIHFDTIVTVTNAMGKNITISSLLEGNMKSSETSDVMSCIMNRLSKSAVYAKLDFSGKPLEIINEKMLSDMILKDTSSITLTGPVGKALKQQVASVVNSDALKSMISTFTWLLPATQVKAGETWTVTQQANSGGMLLDVITNYHLDAINGDNASVTAESSIKPSANAMPIQSGGATVTYDNLQGMSKSTVTINLHTGLTNQQTSKSHISGTLSISAPGFSMQMPMDINGNSKVTALK
jgi:hypothetical protein